MNEIAYKARMAKSTLYYYFKSKEEIFSEVIRIESLILKEQITDNYYDKFV
jgi:AcrR family transcriptional regulator